MQLEQSSDESPNSGQEGRSITFFQKKPDRENDRDADEGHQQGCAGKIRSDDHDDATDHRHPGALLLSVNEIAEANRTPQEGGKKKAGAEHISE